MNKRKITDTEEIGRQIIESNWNNVLRTTPKAINKFEEIYPEVCELVNQSLSKKGVSIGNVFRPGVPDFLAFDDDGSYRFIEIKGEGDGLRHSQLKWFRDFQGVNSEIWFTDSNEGITQKMHSDKLDAYTLKKPETASSGESEVKEGGADGFLNIQIPKTLAAVMNLEPGDKVDWSIKNRSKLELDTD